MRAVELVLGKEPATLRRIGQVALPPGAVRAGEVVDVDTVAEAIRRLWSTVKFSTKKVAVGIANQKVVVRQVDLPWLPEHELRRSLDFQVQDFIPMPVEQAILDYHPLEEHVGENGARMLRVLLVAANRDMVNTTVQAVQEAGLEPKVVDLTSFAVLRSLIELDHLGLSSRDAEAIVDVGASITNIIVHQGGVPRFVRILPMGGSDITEAIADRAGLPLEQAEAIKQRLGIPVRPGAVNSTDTAERILESTGASFVEEVRSSLDYFQAQPGSPCVATLLLSGGGAQLPGLAERLEAAVRIPVSAGTAMSRLSVGKVRLEPEQLNYVAPLVNVPIGLAMGAA